jgi:hypothetical protein
MNSAKRGARPRKPITLSPLSPIAPLISVEIEDEKDDVGNVKLKRTAPEVLEARRSLAAKGELTLTPWELEHIAQPKGARKRGAPARPLALVRGEAQVVARFYIALAYGGRRPDDHSGEKAAERATKKKFDCARQWDDIKGVALSIDGGKWWRGACRAARKRKFEKLARH